MEVLRLQLSFIFPSINPEMCVCAITCFIKKIELVNQWGKDDQKRCYQENQLANFIALT